MSASEITYRTWETKVGLVSSLMTGVAHPHPDRFMQILIFRRDTFWALTIAGIVEGSYREMKAFVQRNKPRQVEDKWATLILCPVTMLDMAT